MEFFPDRNERVFRKIRKPVHRPSNNVIVVASMFLCISVLVSATFACNPDMLGAYEAGKMDYFNEHVVPAVGLGLALGAIVGNLIIFFRNRSVGATTWTKTNSTGCDFSSKFLKTGQTSPPLSGSINRIQEDELRVIGTDTPPNAQQVVPTEE